MKFRNNMCTCIIKKIAFLTGINEGKNAQVFGLELLQGQH